MQIGTSGRDIRETDLATAKVIGGIPRGLRPRGLFTLLARSLGWRCHPGSSLTFRPRSIAVNGFHREDVGSMSIAWGKKSPLADLLMASGVSQPALAQEGGRLIEIGALCLHVPKSSQSASPIVRQVP